MFQANAVKKQIIYNKIINYFATFLMQTGFNKEKMTFLRKVKRLWKIKDLHYLGLEFYILFYYIRFDH